MRLKKNEITIGLIFLVVVLLSIWFVSGKQGRQFTGDRGITRVVEVPITSPSAQVTASPSATPTPKPMTFAEMQAKYGPCVTMPVLMYHHIQSLEEAEIAKNVSLTVTPEMFRKHMEYLKEKGYTTVTPDLLSAYFANAGSLPTKPVMVTFDDGYMDNFINAYPTLRDLGMKAVISLPTGLMENPGYLTWEKIREMNGSSVIYFANHTWSHKPAVAEASGVREDISIAEGQLQEKGLNGAKIFVYPYGAKNVVAEKIVEELGFNLAFTTRPGRVLCAGQKYSLPRVRIGNAELKVFGL